MHAGASARLGVSASISYGLSWLQWASCQVLKQGDIPKHIAFIMDGNRRFARKHSLQVQIGHVCGFNRLTEALNWCLDLGVEEVTVYAFSTENFKRPQAEVDALMTLAKEKFNDLVEHSAIKRHSVCVRVLGDLTMLDPEVRSAIEDATRRTEHHTGPRLNICIAYTSRSEMCHSMDRICAGVAKGDISTGEVSPSLFNKFLYTEGRSPPDLLIRTSGETRLSDFLLWQCSKTHLLFIRVLWPEFSVWHLYQTILQYQLA